MKITDVKAMTLNGYKQWNYVQIETDAGLTGIGEAHPGNVEAMAKDNSQSKKGL